MGNLVQGMVNFLRDSTRVEHKAQRRGDVTVKVFAGFFFLWVSNMHSQ